MNVMRQKPLQTLLAEAGEKKLAKSLGALDITLLGLGAIIGTGIFVLTGVATAEYAGPGLILSFIIACIACAFVCLAYSEMASFIPVAGSSYTYAYASLGELFGWWVGWSLILEYSVGASAVASGWSAYFTSILRSVGINLPKALTAVPSEGGLINLPAALIVLIITGLLIMGTRESVRVNRILVGVKVLTIFLFLFFAAPHIDVANWDPFLPYGWAGVAAGTGVIFFAYVGFDCVSTAAEEAKNPKRDMPIGIIGSLLICTLLYICVAATMSGVVPYKELNTGAPATLVLEYIGVRLGAAIVGTGALCGLSTVLLVLLYSQARSFYAMSRDGLISHRLCKVHPKWHTPHKISALIGIVVALITGLTPINIIAEMCSAGTLFAFICVPMGLLVLRKKYPDAERAFKCPAVKIVAPLGSICCLFIFTQLSLPTIELFVAWSLIGFVVYGLYGRKHSILSQEGAEVVSASGKELA